MSLRLLRPMRVPRAKRLTVLGAAFMWLGALLYWAATRRRGGR